MIRPSPTQAHKADSPPGARAGRGRIGPRFAMGVLALTIVTVPAAESRATSVTAAVNAARPPMLLENHRVLSYPMDQVWPTAIRYLRIDRGFKLTDRDREAGFMLFEFPLEGARLGSGSVEMFETEDSSGRPSVALTVTAGAGPVHLPNAILDGIAAKVRAERGQPAPPPPPPSQDPPKPDKPKDDHSVPLMPPATDPGDPG